MKSGSNLEKLLAAGHFVVTAELGPPKSANREFIEKKAALLAGCADAVNITDNQTAIVRMSSIAAGRIVVEQGLEPVIQMTCRDRNRLMLQSDILGAYALGIKNVLCLSGDYPCFGNHPTAKTVYDIDSLQLVRTVKIMRDDKRVLGGDTIKTEPRMFIGAASNPFASPHEYRVMRLAKKVAAGADFIQTQCIFEVDRFRSFMESVREAGLHEKTFILAGIMPVRSHRALEHINQSVPGFRAPEEYVTRLKEAEDPAEEGIRLAVELIEQVRSIEGVAGIHLMAMMWEEAVATIVERAGLLPRPVLSAT